MGYDGRYRDHLELSMYRNNIFLHFSITLFLLCWSSIYALGQLPYGILDSANVRMGVNADGSKFFLTDQNCQFEVPKDSGTSTIYASHIWLGAIDDDGVLRMAAQTYNQFGSDHWAGPVNPNTGVAASPNNWNKVYKVNKSVIDYHIANYTNSNYVIPAEISGWPGNGSTGFSPIMAPFVEFNSNGIYESWLGDHPYIKGDQALYFIFNDKFQTHGHTSGLPLGVEIHGMAFCYDKPGSEHVSNTVFVRYRVVNRNPPGTDTLNDLYFGVFTDFDIGAANDDYVGSDSVRNMYYGYNSDSYDSTGLPGSGTYGWSPPAQAVVFLNQPMTNTMYYINDLLPIGDPSAPDEYYNYMKSTWRDSTHLTYGGDGYDTSSAPVNYVFSGDPVMGTGWTEGNAGNTPADKRMLGTAGPYSLAPGKFLTVDIAYVYARSDEGNLASVLELKSAVDSIKEFYTNSVVGIAELKDEPKRLVSIYPNPATGIVTLNFLNPDHDTFALSVYDVTGKQVLHSKEIRGTSASMDCSGLRAGIYFIVLSSPRATFTGKLVVEK